MSSLVRGHLSALASLSSAVRRVESLGEVETDARQAAARGHFRPAEEARLFVWFARFLTVRQGLWEVMEEASGALEGDPDRVVTAIDWRCFLNAYVAACLVVRLDRLLVEQFARSSIVQRKLNEGCALHRIPRKQYTAVFRSLTRPRNALRMEAAMLARHRHSELIDALAADAELAPWVERLPTLEASLDRSRSRYLGLWLRYRLHALRRRVASGRQQTELAFLEAGGRAVSEVRDRWRPKRVDASVRQRLARQLSPGDVLVTRHDGAFSNLFLPGYWPHAALYIGSAADFAGRGGELERAVAERWSEGRVTLEALKDGVRFRSLEETLAVDAVVVLRPRLPAALIAEGIARACRHEGKLYDFDFDFFRSDRLVCTEVVYRAFDGLGGLSFELTERAGRPTLSAEDLLDLGLAGRGFEPVALFGADNCRRELVTGDRVPEAVRASYPGS